MDDISLSDIVLSLAGHDSGKLYIVVSAEGNYAFLSDGKVRRLQKPKRKKKKHLSLCAKGNTLLAENIGGGQIRDSEIRRLLAIHRSETK